MSDYISENKFSERSFIFNKNFVNDINESMDINKREKKISKRVIIVSEEEKISHKNEESSNKNISYIQINIKANPNKNIYNEEKSLKNSNNDNNSSSSSQSRKRNRLPLFDRFNNSNDSNSSYTNNKKIISEKCLICEEKLTNNELKYNLLECLHVYCDDCYYNYFKEKINNNKVEKIKCPEVLCDCIIYNNFIEKKLVKDIELLEKYIKLRNRKQLMLDPNVQMCPFPDCESYAKKGDNKYVSCIDKGHKFCFNCLKEWHGEKSCEIESDKNFEKWKNSYKVKRCPRCKYFIEKNEGCNHITCSNCQYQFCWLCLQEYKSDHFDPSGKCFGLQYANCLCFSNKLCLYLYMILIFVLKNLGFALLASFVFIVILYYKFKDNVNWEMNECAFIVSCGSVILLCISFGVLLISISSFISLLMLIIYPLQKIIFDAFMDLF